MQCNGKIQKTSAHKSKNLFTSAPSCASFPLSPPPSFILVLVSVAYSTQYATSMVSLRSGPTERLATRRLPG